MKRRHSLFFRAPFEVDICREPIPAPGYGEVLVQAEVSAISPATEMLFYRDQVPAALPVDATIGELGAADAPDWLRAYLSGEGSYQGADLLFELSGNPEALDQAIMIAGYDGRVLIGSWYGKKKANLTLGSRFHCSNVRLISSQVSFIAPRWRGRFTQARRLHIA